MNSQNADSKILGIIPARGGSKGVPRKNIRELSGRPLLAYTILAFKESALLKHCVVSTEDVEIKYIAENLECDVIDRPPELALDTTPSLPVIQHALLAAERKFGISFSAVCLLQPTTPMRTGKHVDEALELFNKSGAQTLLSVKRMPDHYHPHWAYLLNEKGLLRMAMPDIGLAPRRQDLPPAYIRNGAIYIVDRKTLINQDMLYGERMIPYEMLEQDSVNIDSMDDWRDAENSIGLRKVDF